MLVRNGVHMLQQMEQDGGGDVVGQVADHSGFCSAQPTRHLREVHFQHIGFNHVQLPVQAQAQRQVAVQLNDRQAPQALDQRLRERGQAGADFHHRLARLRCNGLHDGIDDGAIGQKMLAETLARQVLHWGGSRYST